MENDKELVGLKEVYDELWADAKTLVRDMSKGISVYAYAGYITLIISVMIWLNFFPNFLTLLSGNGDFWTWYNAIVGAVGLLVTIPYGAKLIQWYRKLKRKYSKLIEMEKNIGDK